MSSFILNVLVHPDDDINSRLPRYTESELGKAFNVKKIGKAAMSGAYIVVESNITKKLIYEEARTRCNLAHTIEDLTNMLGVEGSLDVSYGLISGSGSGLFESESSRKDLSLNLVQVGYKVVSIEELDTRQLQSDEAREKGTYLASELKDGNTCQDFLDEHGSHYVTRVYKGGRAVRIINFQLKSVLERKKIQAQLKGSLNLGLFSIGFSATYNQNDTSRSDKLESTQHCQALGGDPLLLDENISDAEVDLAVKSKKCGKSWEAYLQSIADNPVVLRLEVEPVSSAIVRHLRMTDVQKDTFMSYVKDAIERRRELTKQKEVLNCTLRRMAKHIEGLSGPGDSNDLMSSITTSVEHYVKHHIEVVLHNLKTYLMRSPLDIANGRPCVQGGSEEATNVDLDNDTEFLTRTGALDKVQMDNFFKLCTKGSRRPFHLPDQRANALWDGPWLCGNPVGMPNEVLFFHSDVNLSELTKEERNQKWVLKVSGEEWNPSTNKPVIDQHTLIEANKQNEGRGHVIDFTRLPDYFVDRHPTYVGEMLYQAKDTTYVGDWKRGEWHGQGVLTFDSPEKKEDKVQAVWARNQIQGEATIAYSGSGGDQRVRYEGQAHFDRDKWSVHPQGRGTMHLRGENNKLEDYEWEQGRVKVRNPQDAKRVQDKHRCVQDIGLHVEAEVQLRERIEKLRAHFSEKAKRELMTQLGEAEEQAVILFWHATLRNSCQEARDLLEVPPPPEVVTVQNYKSGRFLNVEGGSMENGASVIQWDNPQSRDSQWELCRVDSRPTGVYTLKNMKTGKFLNVKDGEMEIGANVQVWDDPRDSSSQWKLWKDYGAEANVYTLMNMKSGNFLNVDDGSMENGANVHQWDDPGKPQSQWSLWSAHEPKQGVYTLMNMTSGKFLNVDGGSMENDANVIQWDNPQSRDSQWELCRVDSQPTGVYTLKNMKSGKFLNLQEGQMQNGANVLQWHDPRDRNSQWRLWKYHGSEADVYMLMNMWSGKFLNLAGGQMENGANVIQWDNLEEPDSQWMLARIDDKRRRIL